MSSLDPILKWGIPFVILLTAWVCFVPWLKKSDRVRWLYSVISSLIITPVVVPGCPGMSVEPLWTVLTTLRLDDLFFMLEIMAFFVLVPVVVTTGVIYSTLRVYCRMSDDAKS